MATRSFITFINCDLIKFEETTPDTFVALKDSFLSLKRTLKEGNIYLQFKTGSTIWIKNNTLSYNTEDLVSGKISGFIGKKKKK